jgi:hypothetical protein
MVRQEVAYKEWSELPPGPYFHLPDYAAAAADHGPNAGEQGELPGSDPGSGS